MLPFRVSREHAVEAFRKWLLGRWFAPSRLKREARRNTRLDGVYVPYWTYDCRATSDYSGLRGDYYYTRESYATTVNGKTVTRQRQVRRIRWTPRAGRVQNRFDDVLVLASHSLPREHTERLEPWDLPNLVPYQDEYLAGFRAESYQTGLKEGFQEAAAIMEGSIRGTVRADMGGDVQQIHSLAVRHEEVTFKHVLLPLWISAYRFRKRTCRFLVNARTGEVQGERPWSWVKIGLAALGGATLVALLVWLVSQ